MLETGPVLTAIIETAIDGIITIDKRGIVLSMNPAAGKLFGYDPSEIVGQSINSLMPEPHHSAHDGYIHRYETTRVPHIIGIGREVEGLRKDGTLFPFRLAVSEVQIGNETIYTGIIHDLSDIHNAQSEILALNKKLKLLIDDRTNELEKTVNLLLSTNRSLEKEVHDRIEAEEKLRQSQKELQEALNKEKELSELKSRFVSMASHEFRTPLTSIASSAAIISKYTQTEQQANREKHIERIKSSVANLTGILNDFLSLSKLEAGVIEVHWDKVDVEELCMEVMSETSGILKPGQQILQAIQGEPREIYADKRILRNTLFNLLSNAIKYSDQNISCRMIYGENQLQIEVEDQGIGIPLEDQKYLFTRFFRAGNVTNIQGTGLGLNIVKRYIDLLGGQIDFISTPEQGTTFTITLPNNHE